MFLIIDHSMEVEDKTKNAEVYAEIDLLEEQIAEGERNLVRLRNDLADADLDIVEAKGLSREISHKLAEIDELIASLDEGKKNENQTTAELEEDIEKLESSIKDLELDRDIAKETSAVEFAGDGRRQYLSGIRTDGTRALVLLDASASMLSNSLINIAALKYFPDNLKVQTEKWTQAISSLKWIISNLRETSSFQIIAFNDQAKLVSSDDTPWIKKSDSARLLETLKLLESVIPSGSSNLHAGFSQAFSQETLPDNVFLITDGLPTAGQRGGEETRISAKDRERLYREAIKIIPSGIPINTILLPLEGDPKAAVAFWELAYKSQGSVLAPSRDWP